LNAGGISGGNGIGEQQEGDDLLSDVATRPRCIVEQGSVPDGDHGLIVVIAICRMPPVDLSRLVFRLLDATEARSYVGYVLSVVVTCAWAVHSKRPRREMAAEIKRLSEQRNQLQQMALDGQIKSSRRRK
jgi:hypothetical protein